MSASDVNQRAAALYLLKLKKAALSFPGFMEYYYPEMQFADFQLELQEVLDLLEKDALVTRGGNPVRNLLINMPPRHAKLLADDTPMLTTNGWTTHGELKVGDYVFGSDGKPTMITNVTQKSAADVRITMTDGSSFLCNEDHLWTVWSRPIGRWVTVPTSHWLTKAATRGSGTRVVMSGGRSVYQLPNTPCVAMPHADLPLDPYILGAWLGDGSERKPAVTHHENDTEVVDGVSRIYPVSASYRHTVGDKKTLTTYFGSGTKGVTCDMTKALQGAGVWGNKHIPRSYMMSSEEQRLALLAGLIDTDGSVDKNGRVRIVTVVDRLRDDYMELITSLGFRPYLMTSRPSGKGKKDVFSIGFQPTRSIPTKVPRKVILNPSPEIRRVGIKSVERIGGDAIGHCITVSNADGLYLAGRNLTVTHNSFHSTINLPAYALMRRPEREIMVSAYNAELAATFGRATREIVTDQKATKPFSHFELSKESRAVDFWKTKASGAYYAVGLGGTTTGRGSSVLIIDDPYKSREEADSATGRRKVWDFYTSGLLSRMQPDKQGQPAFQIVTHTRWHPDDMAGRIMETPEYKRGEWHHLNFQALTERAKKRYTSRSMLDKSDDRYIPNITNAEAGAEGDPDRPFIDVGSKRTGDAAKVLESSGMYTSLWPKRFDVDWLLKQKQAIGEREFAALYQQSPYIIGGNILKTSWLKRYNTLELPEMHAIAVAVDTAFKARNSSDYSVFSVGGITTMGDIYLMKVIREKLEFPDLKRKAIAVNAAYRGQGLRGFWVEDKASGQSLIQELRSDSGVPVIPWKTGTDDKVARANSITPLIEAGRVFVPEEAEWLDDWLQEISAFPSVKHDDQVDSFVMLVDVLSRMVVSGMREFSEPLGNLVGVGGDIRLDSGLLFSNAALTADPHGWLGRGGIGKALDVKWNGWGE